EGEEEVLMPMISELGLAHSVRLMGRVGREDYWRALASADLAVQLRSGFNAGASGAVSDCIAARVPVITSSIGWATELPENVVLEVPEEWPADALAEFMVRGLSDQSLRAKVMAAQDRYAEDTSFARVAERYAELLAL